MDNVKQSHELMKQLNIMITLRPLTFKEIEALALKWSIVENTLVCFNPMSWVNEESKFNWIKFYRNNRINYHKS